MLYIHDLLYRYKGGITPLRIAYEAGDKSKIDYNKLIKFKPVILDLFSSDYCKMSPQCLYVTESDNRNSIQALALIEISRCSSQKIPLPIQEFHS